MEQLDRLAEQQHGVVTRAQALAVGMTHEQIRWQCVSGRWQRPHQGVYVCHSGTLDWSARAAAA